MEIEEAKVEVDEALKEAARALDRHYTASRYPDALPNLAPKDAYDENTASAIKEKAITIMHFVE